MMVARAGCVSAMTPRRETNAELQFQQGHDVITRSTPMLRRGLPLAPGEAAPALWSFAYFFCVLASYYLLRPVRDALAADRGVEQLPLLPGVYAFFIACILSLFVVLRGATPGWAAATFFVWVSVFNLFVVSVFWSYMADLWREEQARRLFGFISAGGSGGALLGPALAAVLAPRLGPANLLPLAAAVLAGALICIARLRRWSPTPHGAVDDATPIGGGPWAASCSSRARGTCSRSACSWRSRRRSRRSCTSSRRRLSGGPMRMPAHARPSSR
jgi:MFS family permease